MRAGALALALAAIPAVAQVTSDAPVRGNPDAIVDLRTPEGAALVKAQWRFAEGDGPETPIPPDGLETRRTMGGRSFGWYRTSVTIPEKVASFSTAGSAIVFEIVVDDYAEVRVDGALPRVLGQTGGPLVKGFNAPNRVVLTDDAKPGRTYGLEIFAANGPLAEPPDNRVWVRSATLDFHARGELGGFEVVPATIERHDAALEAIVPKDAVFERIARGFQFTEGPVWVKDGGYLLFSDPNANTIYRWTPDGQVTVYRTKSGYSGPDSGEYGQPGSNGLALDREGRLTICEHGRRRVVRLERNGSVTVLADRFEGKRLNSPNDLAYRSDGTLYFTDPPFGLPAYHDDPRRELPFYGVYALADGVLRVVAKDLLGPNGIAFSPDERFLYIANWDPARKIVMRYPVRPDGSLEAGRVFFDMGAAPEAEALDGIEVDPDGNLFVSGPGGVWILSPEGVHLGTIRLPEPPANFAFGGADGRTLFLTARTSVVRVRL